MPYSAIRESLILNHRAFSDYGDQLGFVAAAIFARDMPARAAKDVAYNNGLTRLGAGCSVNIWRTTKVEKGKLVERQGRKVSGLRSESL